MSAGGYLSDRSLTTALEVKLDNFIGVKKFNRGTREKLI
jgi:hypothetical protein